MTDLEFIEIYKQSNCRIPTLCKQSIVVKDFLSLRFPDCSEKDKVEAAYRILHNMEEKPKCPVCGKPIPFVSMKRGYRSFCSNECMNSSLGKQISQNRLKESMIEKYGVDNPQKSKYIKEKTKQTCLKKYGVEYCAQNKEIKNKQKQTMLQRYGIEHALQSSEFKDKVKDTMLERYGVEHSLQSKDSQNKFKQTMQQRYGVNYTGESKELQTKMRQTSLDKYGVDNPMKNEEMYKKVKQTCLERYGVEYISQSEKIKQRIQENNLKKYGVKFTTQLESVKQKIKETNIKRYGTEYVMRFINKGKQTKKDNGTYSTSKVEELLYKKLCKFFGSENIQRQYKSDIYPFSADFYIIPNDLYIEIQGSWTHGPHPFDETNKDDIILKDKWLNKKSEYYKSAIDVWLDRDPKKRQIAKEQNINFIEIFSINSEYCFNCIMMYIVSKQTGYQLY